MKILFNKIIELYICYSLIKKFYSIKEHKKNILTWSRSSSIFPFMLNKTVNIYNGFKSIPLHISKLFFFYNVFSPIKNLHKLGEFSKTRRSTVKRKKKSEQKVKKK